MENGKLKTTTVELQGLFNSPTSFVGLSVGAFIIENGKLFFYRFISLFRKLHNKRHSPRKHLKID